MGAVVSAVRDFETPPLISIYEYGFLLNKIGRKVKEQSTYQKNAPWEIYVVFIKFLRRQRQESMKGGLPPPSEKP